jgi:hypothetical protein
VIEYQNIRAYRVTCRLLGKPIVRADAMAEHLPCGGCGAKAGYFCLMRESDGVYPTRLTCQGIIGSQNPRTLLAFARGAEEIERAKKK